MKAAKQAALIQLLGWTICVIILVTMTLISGA